MDVPLSLQMFTEFTELFSAHCCTGRQLNTSSIPQIIVSLISIVEEILIELGCMESDTNTKHKHPIIANIAIYFMIRISYGLLFRSLFFSFLQNKDKHSLIQSIVRDCSS